MHDDAVVPAALVLSHVEQLTRLRRYCPPAADVAVIAGDPCLDRMAASGHLRAAYRRAFGIAPGRRLVVVSSTWGPRSLLGRFPRLPRRFAAELPMDGYATVVALHPNVWHAHSPWQTQVWLADCVRSGVVLAPPMEVWRAALLAADVVVGDHGSVTFYAAALGRPVLLAATHPEGVDPASPIARLSAAAPMLSPDLPLADQLDEVIDGHREHQYREIVDEATSAPGQSAALLRTLLYRFLNIPEPDGAAVTPTVPIPRQRTVRPTPVTAILARTDVPDLAVPAVLVERFPAEMRLANPPPGDTHLVVAWTHRDPRLLELADVVLCRADDTYDEPRTWVRQTLREFPGCLIAAVARAEGSCLLAVRNGPTFELFSGYGGQRPDAAVLASAAFGWLAAGSELGGTEQLIVEVGGATYPILVRAVAAD
jgi:hypothetical protein